MNEHHIFGEYVLTPIKNAFNNKTGWWLSKRGYGNAMYCFSTDGTEQSQKSESDYQMQHIDSYMSAFENCFGVKE